METILKKLLDNYAMELGNYRIEALANGQYELSDWCSAHCGFWKPFKVVDFDGLIDFLKDLANEPI